MKINKLIILSVALLMGATNIRAQNGGTLQDFLKKNNYVLVPLQKNKIGHFVIKGKINGKDALFILDTGASGTCIDLSSAKKMRIHYGSDSNGKAAGYGGDAGGVDTANGIIQLEQYKTDSMTLSIIDLTSVNQAYSSEIGEHIDGIIGFDILNGYDAIIDYKTSSLYLKPEARK